MQFLHVPAYLCIEEASSGAGLIDIIESQIPTVASAQGKGREVQNYYAASRLRRFTSAGSVPRLRSSGFECPVHHGRSPTFQLRTGITVWMRQYTLCAAFTGTGQDFQKPLLLPAPRQRHEE